MRLIHSMYMSATERADIPLFRAPLAKTPEELALENTSLRHSLDTLASHTQSLEQTNRLLKIQLEERDKKLLTAMAGVKKEAARAKQGQELWRSQIMAGSILPVRAPRIDGSPISSVPGLKDGPGSDSIGQFPSFHIVQTTKVSLTIHFCSLTQEDQRTGGGS